MSHSQEILGLISEAAMLVKSGKLAYMNPAAEEILGRDSLGQPLKALFGPEVAGVQGSSFAAGVSRAGRRYILRMSRLDGENVIFLRSQELPPAILNEAFLCTMRESLMSIGMTIGSIRERAEDLEEKEILNRTAALTRSYHRLIRLSANASLVLNAASGPLPTGECAVNATELFRSLTNAAAFFVPTVSFHAELGTDILCSADPDLLRQMFTNLLSNCLIHAEGCTTVSVSLTESFDSLILSVSNDGRGIEPDRLHTVFDRFRYGFGLSGMNSGPGLGLSVVRCIAEAHGGTLLLESRPDRGTTVRVSLSRRLRSGLSLRSPRVEEQDYARDILTGLSDYLPAECYGEKFMD